MDDLSTQSGRAAPKPALHPRTALFSIEPSVPYAERKAIDLRGLKEALCGMIVEVLDSERWSHTKAEDVTGVAAQDFSRVRQRRLELFKVERLIYMLHRLGREIEIKIDVSPRPAERKPRRSAG